MNVLAIVLRLLDFILGRLESQKQEEAKREADKAMQHIRSDPRDFFDDGMLNKSTDKHGKNIESNSDSVSSDGTPRQP
jgi:hypothetical protein